MKQNGKRLHFAQLEDGISGIKCEEMCLCACEPDLSVGSFAHGECGYSWCFVGALAHPSVYEYGEMCGSNLKADGL